MNWMKKREIIMVILILPYKIYGMDQFIGETEYWNRGLGTASCEIHGNVLG